MSRKRRFSPGYALCMAILALIALAGVALILYGSASNGVPVPRLPGSGHFAAAKGLLHG